LGEYSLTFLQPPRFGGHRGFFGETYSRLKYAEIGIDVEFVQDNHSLSHAVGTLRGLQVGSPDEVVHQLRWITKNQLGQRAMIFEKIITGSIWEN
jgi:dTDP-4-dehydrorhamnose 3,5-epimerase-like enzyme